MPETQQSLVNAITEFSSNFTSIISTLKTANPEMNIYVQTIYNPFHSIIPETDQIINMLNTTITSGSDSVGYTVVDVYSAFQGNESKYINSDDGIHPNQAGHNEIFNLYYKAITGNDYTGDISLGDSSQTIGESDQPEETTANTTVPTVNESPKTGDPGVGKIAFIGGAAVVIMAVAGTLKARKKSDKE
jgi:hypothetical protein